jgi:G3E family GTPase
MPIEDKIPVTIVTGFLGSGKTTIISHLIDYLIQEKQKVAYVKNEIGDISIDGKLMVGKNIATRELLNGCICCTLTGPFYHAINELVDTVNPDRIIIEASGVADPATIALFVSAHPKVYRDGVIAVIDVVNFSGYKNLSLTARRQAELTDLIVFNKIELVDLARKQAVVGYIRELNEFAPIVEAPDGVLDPELAFGLDTTHLQKLLVEEKDNDHHLHLHNEFIQSFTVTTENLINRDLLKTFLENLPPNIIRVKGIVNLSEKNTILINKVGIRIDFNSLDKIENNPVSRLVCIGFGIKNLQEQVQDGFNKCV